jgi:hypothetical protein
MQAKDLLTKIEELYANCSSYEDRGFVTNGTETDRAMGTFKTKYEIPDSFHFEYTSCDGTVLTLQSESQGTTLKSSRGREEKFASIDKAFRAIKGKARHSTVSMVPMLLFSKLPQPPITVSKLARVTIDLHPPRSELKVEGHVDKDTCTLWIQKDINLIKQCTIVAQFTPEELKMFSQHIRELQPGFDEAWIAFTMPAFIETVVYEFAQLA